VYRPWYLEGADGFTVRLFERAEAVDAEYLKEGEQKENLCGPFAAAYILRGLGFRYHGGNFVDQEYVAYLARTRIRTGEGRLYKYSLIETSSPVELGTSALGLKRAIEAVSGGRLSVVPVKASDRASGAVLKGRDLKRLVNYFADFNKVQLVLNLNTKYMPFGPELNRKVITHDLQGLQRREPVGHFVSCAGFLYGNETYFVIRETYKRYGVQIQPFESILGGLNRDDGREGGILVIVPREYEEKIARDLKEEGFLLSIWDNGSPF